MILNGDASSSADPRLADPAVLGTAALSVDFIESTPSPTTGAPQPGAPAKAAEDNEEHDADDVTAEIASSELLITTTNFSDDFAHRGPLLRDMVYYTHSMHVSRALRTKGQVDGPLRRFVPFDEHYALYKSHTQVVKVNVAVPGR